MLLQFSSLPPTDSCWGVDANEELAVKKTVPCVSGVESTECTLRGHFLVTGFALFLALGFNSENDCLILCYLPTFLREEVIGSSAQSLPHQTTIESQSPPPSWVGRSLFRERGDQSLCNATRSGKAQSRDRREARPTLASK